MKLQQRSVTDSSAFRVLLFFAIANVANVAFDRFVSGSRPGMFNMDYLIVPVLHALLSGWRKGVAWAVAIVIMTVLLAADLFSTVTEIYFAGPAMLLDYLPFISLWPWRWIGAIMLGLVIFATPLIIVVLGPTPHRIHTIVASIVLVIALLTADRLATISQRSPNIASSGIMDVLHPSVAQFIDEFRKQTTRLRPSTTPTMASSIEADGDPPPRILSVSVESWGRLKDGATDTAMIAPLMDGLHDRYVVAQNGLHPFYGATLAGEVRELCALKQTGGVPRGADQYRQLRNCLPAWLARRGYRTVALHGNAGSFYRRTRFYPMMGFTEHWHYEQMHGQVATLCSYLFVGICDRDAARIAVSAFDGTPRAFVHLMTLDTHLPLPAATGPCRTDPEPDLCTYRRDIARSLGAIAAAVRTARSPPDLIVLYGDHAPPFVDRRLRARFVDGKVPFVVLRKR